MSFADTFEESILHQHWARSVKQGTADDFLICITASSRTGVSGTGKTTLETQLAKQTDLTEDGFDAEQKASLDAAEIAYDIVPDIPACSTVVWDEAQGAPGTVGLDARRAMKQEAIDSMSSILANRDKQLTIIITAQIFSMLDPRIYPMIDAWLLIRRGPNDGDGPLGTYHQVYVEDYNLENPTVKTPAIEDFTWPRVRHDDPDYRELERLKQEAKTQDDDEDEEEDDELDDEVQKMIAQEWRDQGYTPRWIAENIDAVDYSYSWIYDHTEDRSDEQEAQTA